MREAMREIEDAVWCDVCGHTHVTDNGKLVLDNMYTCEAVLDGLPRVASLPEDWDKKYAAAHMEDYSTRRMEDYSIRRIRQPGRIEYTLVPRFFPLIKGVHFRMFVEDA